MTRPVPNMPLIDGVLKFIKTNPERHNQALWMNGEQEASGTEVVDAAGAICGTTGCLAGWGAIIAGYHQVRPFSDPDWCRMPWETSSVTAPYVYDRVVDETGAELHMENAATKAFGLCHCQADRLFAPDNSVEDIERIIDSIRSNPHHGCDQTDPENCTSAIY